MGDDGFETGWLQALGQAVDKFDRLATAKLADDFVAQLDLGLEPRVETIKTAVKALRRKCFFAQIEQIVAASRLVGVDAPLLRQYHAQSLIDQGKAATALDVLDSLLRDGGLQRGEEAEARGLVGRVHKQLYVDAVNANPLAKERPRTRLWLQRAVDAYSEVYSWDPAEYLWHGINVVALVKRAERDVVPLSGKIDAAQVAREILTTIAAREKAARETAGALDYWDVATAGEANVALGDYDAALLWTARYLQHEKADAFELSSTERQLREVWGLTVQEAPGSLLLPLLQAGILQRKGGGVKIAAEDVAESVRQADELGKDPNLQAVFSKGGMMVVTSYKLGLQRAEAVGQVKSVAGDAKGTGFLVRGGDLYSALGDELVLLTNAHVVSDDPVVQQAKGALPASVAAVSFEFLSGATGKSFAVAQLWSSPPAALDATLLRLQPRIEAQLSPYPVAPQPPVVDGEQKVYVIGHPAGRALTISLSDNLLLAVQIPKLHYRTPTERGSSGSPVFDQTWGLIGLHHAGGVEMPRLDGKPGIYEANEGIWIRRIAEVVTQAAPVV